MTYLFTSAYCDVINTTLIPYILEGPFPDGCFTYQHDLSPIHQARATRTLLEEFGVNVLSWPPKGADMNIIKNIWGLMKRNLARQALHRASQEELAAAVEAEWISLRAMPGLVQELYDSLSRRMSAVIDAGGGFTKY